MTRLQELVIQIGCCWAVVFSMGTAPNLFAIQLDTAYGGSQGELYRKSVNGTVVFAELIKDWGARVMVREQLGGASDYLSIDTAFWFPDRFGAPTAGEIDSLEAVFDDHPNLKNLVIVLRDYDAAHVYWESIVDELPEQSRGYAEVMASLYRENFEALRAEADPDFQCDWFEAKILDEWEPPTTINGALARGIDVEKIRLVPSTRLNDPGRRDAWPHTLLWVNGRPFVMRVRPSRHPSVRVFVVANGSFLLNLPLVNHENRRLAQNLIRAIDPSEVVFLESGMGELDDPPNPEGATVWSWMQTGPLRLILPQCILLFLVYCFCHFPIFGRPRAETPMQIADSSNHIDAAGQLYAEAGDRRFATHMIRQYQDGTKS